MVFMKKTLIVAAAAAVVGMNAPAVHADPSPSPKKKQRTVWVAPPTGSLLGGGVTNAGDADDGPPASAARLSAEYAPLRKSIVELDSKAGTEVEGWTLIAAAVSWQTKVPQNTLKQQHSSTGLTFGELLIANSLASGSNTSFESILAMKKKARNWSDLAKQLKINPDSIVARARAATESIRLAHSRRNQRREENLRDSGLENSRLRVPQDGG